MSANLMSLAQSGGKFLKLFGDRKMMKLLPYDAEVEYLESTGAQYIDTGIYAVNNIIVEGSVILADYTAIEKPRMIIGTDYTGSGYTFVIRQPFDAGKNCLQVMFGGWWTTCPYNASLDAGVVATFRYDREGKIFVVNGNIIRAQTPSDFSQHKILIGKNMNQGYSKLPSLKTVHIKIHIGDNPVRDFIPVRFTNENGVSEGAMFDRVSGQLFRNQGTGDFIIGPDKTI